MISKYLRAIPLLLIFLIMAAGCGTDFSPAAGTSSTTSSNTADTTAPTFAGLKKLSVLNTTSVELSWSAATDNSTPISYHIYMANSSGGQDFNSPNFTTNLTTSEINGLTEGETYYFLVRAEDANGNIDSNRVEKAVAMVEWVDPAGPPTYINKDVNATKATDEPSLAFNGTDVYAGWVEQDGSGNAQTYVEYWDGTSGFQDFGGGGTLNENTAKSSKEVSVAFKDTTPYVAWSEHTWSGPTIIGGDVYMKKWTGASWELLGESLRDTGYSIATIGHSSNVIPEMPHIAFIQRDSADVEQLFVKRWNEATPTWDLLAGSNPNGSLNVSSEQSAGLPVLTYLDTIPYVAWVEGSDGAESEGDIYVKKLNGTTWELVGGKLNSGNTHHHPWITSDGNTVYVSWAEENTSGKSQAYVAKWTGTDWMKLGGSLNIDSSKDANHARVAMSDSASGSIPYAAWVEKNDAGVNQLYVRHWDGVATWVLDGGTLNVDPNRGVTEPHLAVNGNVPYVAWVEVGGGLWPVYVKYLP